MNMFPRSLRVLAVTLTEFWGVRFRNCLAITIASPTTAWSPPMRTNPVATAARSFTGSPKADWRSRTFSTRSRPAYTARSASCSCPLGYPNNARMLPLPLKEVTTTPPHWVTTVVQSCWKRWTMLKTSSGSSRIAIGKSTSMQDNAVNCRISGAECHEVTSGARGLPFSWSTTGGGSPFSTVCGFTANLYPTPGTERINRGLLGSCSILRRSRATVMSTLRSSASAPRPTTAWRSWSRDSTRQGLRTNPVRACP